MQACHVLSGKMSGQVALDPLHAPHI